MVTDIGAGRWASRLCIAVFTALLICNVSMAADTGTPDDNVHLEKALGFIGAVSGYQGQFDSVVNFCRPHAPGFIVQHSTSEWYKRNRELLELKDREVKRVVALARARGAPQENIDAFMAIPDKLYRNAADNDRMHKDLKGKPDLSTACASRLGEMLSDSMKLDRVAPDAWAYFQATRVRKAP
jgi:hypothetical protein